MLPEEFASPSANYGSDVVRKLLDKLAGLCARAVPDSAVDDWIDPWLLAAVKSPRRARVRR